MDKKTVLSFFALCGDNKRYRRVPYDVKIYMRDGVPSLKIAQKFSSCVGSPLWFVQGLLLNS